MRRKNFQYLKEHILPLSNDKSDFNIAKTEWKLHYIFIKETFGQCPCTQEIKEHCVIKNEKNGNMTYVGNICVKRFLEIDARKLFNGMRKIIANREAKPNRDLIEYAHQKGYLYGSNEYGFLRSIVNKRKLSEKQIKWLLYINRRIVEKIVVRELPNPVDLNDQENVIIGQNAINNDHEQNTDTDDDSDADATNDSGNNMDYKKDDDESEESDMETDATSDSENDMNKRESADDDEYYETDDEIELENDESE